MKRFILDCLRVFALIFLGTSICAALYITIFHSWDTAVSIVIVWEFLLVSFLATLGNFFYLSKKEPSPLGLILRRIFHFIYIDGIVLLFGYLFSWFDFQNPLAILFIEGGILFIFFAICFGEYLLGKAEAEKLNSQLKKQRKEE
ncbi:MAG: DUF3021 family protein [Eubacteriales bacterium]|nr:DUF3021 family protein [Eubacteriales bacterium]